MQAATKTQQKEQPAHQHLARLGGSHGGRHGGGHAGTLYHTIYKACPASGGGEQVSRIGLTRVASRRGFKIIFLWDQNLRKQRTRLEGRDSGGDCGLRRRRERAAQHRVCGGAVAKGGLDSKDDAFQRHAQHLRPLLPLQGLAENRLTTVITKRSTLRPLLSLVKL